jgi:hypothetical protein
MEERVSVLELKMSVCKVHWVDQHAGNEQHIVVVTGGLLIL